MQVLIVYPASCIIIVIIFLLMPVQAFVQVRTGADRTDTWLPMLMDRNVALVANSASVAGGENILDVLLKNGIRVKRVFSPEHGFRMNAEAGQTVDGGADPVTGLEVVSLYGKHKKPTRSDLAGIDLVVFDLQDAGVRFYTYISTLAYVMEASAENNVPMVVFDRPNPNGFYIDGPVLEKQYASFVGMHPVPVVYGMTIGEYAGMVNGEGWLNKGLKCDLRVVKIENYTHDSRYELPAGPSPNLPNPDAVYLYPSLCLFEGTVVSVGRGTDYPFQIYGHPRMKSGKFTFTPRSIPGASLHPPYEGKMCYGFDLRGAGNKVPSVTGKLDLSWLIGAYRELSNDTSFFNDYFDKLAGTGILRKQITRGAGEKEIRKSWQPGINAFRKIRVRYLLYK